MKCLVCNQKIVIKRTLWNLFNNYYFTICLNCFIKNPIQPKLMVYPIENALLYHMNLAVNNNFPLAYQYFIGPILYKVIKQDSLIIVMYEDDFTIELYKLLDMLKLGNIFLLTLQENKDNKGEEL